jgi:hypothetical protein
MEVINIRSIVNPCLSRKRGHEAADNLARYLSSKSITLDLDSDSNVSLSFLDGLVLRLNYHKLLDKTVFKTEKLCTIAKLSNISEIRQLDILTTEPLIAQSKKPSTPVFISDKNSLVIV